MTNPMRPHRSSSPRYGPQKAPQKPPDEKVIRETIPEFLKPLYKAKGWDKK